MIKKIGQDLSVDTITDIHESHEAEEVSTYVNHLQIPAFLCRQTSLLIVAENRSTCKCEKANSCLTNP